MNDLRQQTIEVYERSARDMAEKFRGMGARILDIELAFELAGNPKGAHVVEIGCGDGRDAAEISKRAGWYRGFDVSPEFVKIAKEYVPDASFEIADVATYDFPSDLDIVFAFASLLHSDKVEVEEVLQRAAEALKPRGIFFISLKSAPEYTRYTKKDQFGERLFYLYTPELIEQLAGPSYETATLSSKAHGDADWFEIALCKV